MPVTPFHLGPALLIKAACPKWFSLGVFAVVQIAIDLEAVWYILARNYPGHGPVHTLPGSLVLGAAAIAPAKYGLSRLYEAIRQRQATSADTPRWLLAELKPISWTAAITGGLFGGLSHVLLDATIHADVMPFVPLSRQNPLFLPYSYLLDSFVWVHVLCAIAGGLGLLTWLALAKRRASRQDSR